MIPVADTLKKLPIKIFTWSNSVDNNVNVNVDYSHVGFTEKPAVSVYCVQNGFAAPSTIAVDNITTSGCRIKQRNTGDAAMLVGLSAIGV